MSFLATGKYSTLSFPDKASTLNTNNVLLQSYYLESAIWLAYNAFLNNRRAPTFNNSAKNLEVSLK